MCTTYILRKKAKIRRGKKTLKKKGKTGTKQEENKCDMSCKNALPHTAKGKKVPVVRKVQN